MLNPFDPRSSSSDYHHPIMYWAPRLALISKCCASNSLSSSSSFQCRTHTPKRYHSASIDGVEKRKPYTPVSPVTQRGSFSLLVKTYEAGNVSKYLHSLQVGDEVQVRGPTGSFEYHANKWRTISMIAGGTGITPMTQVRSRALSRSCIDRFDISSALGHRSCKRFSRTPRTRPTFACCSPTAPRTTF